MLADSQELCRYDEDVDLTLKKSSSALTTAYATCWRRVFVRQD
jgi:hypothetical protein